MGEILTDEQRRAEKKKRDLLKQLICDVVVEYKHNKRLDTAASIIVNNNISFEDIVNTTVKLDMYNLASLADNVIQYNEKTK